MTQIRVIPDFVQGNMASCLQPMDFHEQAIAADYWKQQAVNNCKAVAFLSAARLEFAKSEEAEIRGEIGVLEALTHELVTSLRILGWRETDISLELIKAEQALTPAELLNSEHIARELVKGAQEFMVLE
jgi:hypothetical protein